MSVTLLGEPAVFLSAGHTGTLPVWALINPPVESHYTSGVERTKALSVAGGEPGAHNKHFMQSLHFSQCSPSVPLQLRCEDPEVTAPDTQLNQHPHIHCMHE